LADRRRNLGLFAILALVLLRLAIGWHFLREGLGKLAYDGGLRQYHIAFSAESFLSQAKGPLAERFHAWAPNGHVWAKLLAVPRQSHELTAEEMTDHAKWLADYEQRRTTAEAKKEAAPVEFPPFEPYHDWAVRITDDWRSILSNVTAIGVLSDEQRQRAAEIFHLRLQQLADYLAEQSDAIVDYQHELWRLDGWRASAEAADVPYMQKRIAGKSAETAAMAAPWIKQVNEFERQFIDDLRAVLTSDQKAQATTAQLLDNALTSPQQARLHRLDIAVTILTITVGVCLLVGLFTRLASLAGAIFLLAVIVTQPPWIVDAVPTYNQIVEFAALLVLAATGAGRWFGFDFITYALFHRRRDMDD
jgi:uncharacterized membrane protein YphA (DoxX/SURF4 family)